MKLMSTMGAMVSFATWQKVARQSAGSDAMKRQVIDYVRDNIREGDFIDSFRLGLALGAMWRAFKDGGELADFEATIEPTRDLNKVPIVRRNGHPVS